MPEPLDFIQRMDAISRRQGGFFYPWISEIDGEDGEGAYAALVERHLTPGAMVVEAGCGHGPDISRFAPKCGRYVGYDLSSGLLEIAEATVRDSGLTNVELMHANSSPAANGGRARLPVDDGAADLVISRRGPTNWIVDAPRAVRPGGRLIQINPAAIPLPVWNERLPQDLRLIHEVDDVPDRIGALLETAGLALEQAWFFDVPERFADALSLHAFLAWTRFHASGLEAPPFEAVNESLERTFRDHAGPGGLELRKRRYLWTARV